MNTTRIRFLVMLAIGFPGACHEAEPIIRPQEGLSPSLPARQLSAARRTTPSRMEVTSMLTSNDEGEQGRCTEWVLEEQHQDPLTGEFSYRYRCPEGGDTESIVTLGQSYTPSNGRYTTTYNKRDGSVVVWSYVFATTEDGITHYNGSATDGSRYEGDFRAISLTETWAREHYVMPAGAYDSEGVYDQAQFLTGTSTFDDPDTLDRPDYTLSQSKDASGNTLQEFHSLVAGWERRYTARYREDGSMDYRFEYDDHTTHAAPDFVGSYLYARDRSGTGSYTQYLDQGSTLDVTHQMSADGSFTETWIFHDAATAQDVDQQGTMHYQANGNGEGTVTTYVQGGGVETCDMHVVDGSTIVDNCR